MTGSLYAWCRTGNGITGFTPADIVEWRHSEEYESYEICKEEGDDPVCYWYHFNEHFELYGPDECDGYWEIYPEVQREIDKLERKWKEEHGNQKYARKPQRCEYDPDDKLTWFIEERLKREKSSN